MMICQKVTLHLVFQHGKTLHLTKELEAYTKEGFFLHSCSFDELEDVVHQTYHAFVTMRLAYMAMAPDEEKAQMYFAMFIDPSHDSLFPSIDETSTSGVKKGCNNASNDSTLDDDNTDGMRNEDENVEMSEVVFDFDDEHTAFEATENVSGDVLMHNNALLWQDLLGIEV